MSKTTSEGQKEKLLAELDNLRNHLEGCGDKECTVCKGNRESYEILKAFILEATSRIEYLQNAVGTAYRRGEIDAIRYPRAEGS